MAEDFDIVQGEFDYDLTSMDIDEIAPIARRNIFDFNQRGIEIEELPVSNFTVRPRQKYRT